MPQQEAVTAVLRSALPGRRSHVTRADVAASQRGRLLDAVTQSVADKGYAATTVADVVMLAGVSRTTFYQHFQGKSECFLEAYQSGFNEVRRDMNAAAGAHEDWLHRLRASIGQMLTSLAQAPDFARAFFVEVLAAGEDALALRTQIMGMFADALAGNFALARAGRREIAEVPRHLLDTVVGGITELIAIRVRTRAYEDLPALEPRITHFMLAVLLGNGQAEAMLRQQGTN